MTDRGQDPRYLHSMGETRYPTRRERESTLIRVAVFVALFILVPEFARCTELNADEYFEDPAVVQLARAVQRSELPEMERIANSGVSVNALGRKGETLLYWALRTKQKPAFLRLLQLGAGPNSRSDNRRTIVHWAAGDPDGDWLRMALEFGGDPNVAFGGGETPLFSAIESFQPGHVDLLLAAGAEIDHEDAAGETAMLKAASMLQYPLVLHLLQEGASYSVKNKWGNGLPYYLRKNVPAAPDLQAARKQVITFLEERGVELLLE